MGVRFSTGWPQEDIEDEFRRARRRCALAQLAGWLRLEPGGASLLNFDEVVRALGLRDQYYLGLRTIRLDTVAGTIEARPEFDRAFRPTTNRVRERWEQLALAQRRGVPMPPIDVYGVDGFHFVKDGHHRVSVARATGQEMIDAYVTEVLTQVAANWRSVRRLLAKKS